MTGNAGRAVMDDAQVIGLLRAVDSDAGPPLRYGPERILAAGRHARRRRRALGVAASGMVLASVAALSFMVAQAEPNGRQIVLSPPSSSMGTEEPLGPAEQAEANQQALQTALGEDFAIDPGGDVTVRPGSPSAEGLPTGYTIGTQILALKGDADELAQFCAPMVEKGLVVGACTERVLPGGQIVHEQRARSQPGAYEPGRSPSGAHDSVRVLFVQPNGDLVVVDLLAWELDTTSTPQRRAEAQAWLDVMSPRLADAATDPMVRAIGEPQAARPSDEPRPSHGSKS